MDWLTILYLVFTFLGFYYLFLFILIYSQNKKQMFEVIKPDKIRSLSIVVPCYNEEENIGETIKALLSSDYPGLEKIFVVDDCSKDNSYNVIKKFAKQYSKVVALQTPKNTGNAAGSKNYGAKFVKTELIGFSDSDSFPEKNAISNMVGFFNDSKVGAVTSRVLVKNRRKFLAKLQTVEYKIIAFTRKLLGFVDAIYVTNGPLSIYRKKAFDRVGGFDEKNLTEDIEITWHFVKDGWKVHMALASLVYTVVPETFTGWFKQRLRWNVGGIQTINKYRKTFFSCGMLGAFILPFFVSSWFLGIAGLILLVYRLSRYFIVKYLAASYSIEAQTAILRLNDLSLSPSILFFFGMILLGLSLSFNFLGLSYSKKEKEEFKRESILDVLTYIFIYLLVYPVLLIASLYKYLTGNHKW